MLRRNSEFCTHHRHAVPVTKVHEQTGQTILLVEVAVTSVEGAVTLSVVLASLVVTVLDRTVVVVVAVMAMFGTGRSSATSS